MRLLPSSVEKVDRRLPNTKKYKCSCCPLVAKQQTVSCPAQKNTNASAAL